MNEEELYKLKDLDLELDLNTICNDILEIDFRTKSNMLLQTIINKLQQENQQLKEQLQNISCEFLKYNWKESNSHQINNQLKNLYESIFERNVE